MTQDWLVTCGETRAEVRADNWLGALALALPQLGLDLGVMARLVCATEADGSATAHDSRAGLEIRVTPVGTAAPPSFTMPESSFASINIPFLRIPATPDVATPADASPMQAEAPTLPNAKMAASPTVEIEGPGAFLAVPPPAAALPFDDRMEELFLRLGEINEAATTKDACTSALRLAGELVTSEAGALLIRTRAGDGLRFRAAFGPAAAALLDTTIPLDRGIAGFVNQIGVGVAIGDARRDDRHYARVDKSTGYTTRELLAVPVRAEDGGTYGVLELINPPRPFTADDLELATRVAVSLGNVFRGMDQ